MFDHSAIVLSILGNLLVGISGAPGMTGIHFSAKMCFEKMLWDISDTMSARAFKPLPLYSTPFEKLLVGISGALWKKGKPPFKVGHFFREYSRVTQKWWVLEISKLCHCVQHPWKFTSKDFWSSRNKRKPLFQQKCVLRKAVGYLRNCKCLTTLPLCWDSLESYW